MAALPLASSVLLRARLSGRDLGRVWGGLSATLNPPAWLLRLLLSLTFGLEAIA